MFSAKVKRKTLLMGLLKGEKKIEKSLVAVAISKAEIF